MLCPTINNTIEIVKMFTITELEFKLSKLIIFMKLIEVIGRHDH